MYTKCNVVPGIGSQNQKKHSNVKSSEIKIKSRFLVNSNVTILMS